MCLATAGPEERWLPAVIGLAAMNGLIGILFLLRRPVVLLGNFWQLASCLPTMIGLGFAVRFAPPLAGWPWQAHALFAAGLLLALATFIALGRSFGVFPALRRTVVRGPYRFVRHPAYLGELLMALACFVAGPSWLAAMPWLLLLPGVVWRICAEEAVLNCDAAYAAYRWQVQWRLLPGIW
jgi:protein-S-isoprenylcysteine O-methyltransferase Ste14